MSKDNNTAKDSNVVEMSEFNGFKLLGRINWLDIEYNSETAKPITKIILAKKVPKTENKYESFTITFFNTKNDNVAERLAEVCKKEDYIRVVGKIGNSKFTPKGQDKEVTRLELIGWNFKKVEWCAEKNCYIDCEPLKKAS